MTAGSGKLRWQRRSRPLLGTLVEIGVDGHDEEVAQALESAWSTIARVQACLSRFDPDSDIARFNTLGVGDSLEVRSPTREVLTAASALGDASAGLFDITQGRGGARGWRLAGGRLRKLDAGTSIDLGGIGKGHAVDAAVEALQAAGCRDGWVNAGGDLRAFGAAELTVAVRDEGRGGSRPFARLADGAFATSHYGPTSRSAAWAPDRFDDAGGVGRDSAVGGVDISAHVSVAAPRCLWADALTKVVAASADPGHPLLAVHGARAWLHGPS